jgi:hypothetical protein
MATADHRGSRGCSRRYTGFGSLERLAGFYRDTEERQDFSAATQEKTATKSENKAPKNESGVNLTGETAPQVIRDS